MSSHRRSDSFLHRHRSSALIGLCAAIALVAAVGFAATSEPAPALVHAPARFLSIASQRGTVTSTNWSGYADTSAAFTDVHATWVQPTASCTTTGHKYASFWVGLDGYTSSSVEQIGTDSDCLGRAKPAYYGWFEMYPAPSVNLSGYVVMPGDSLTADVVANGNSFTLTLRDNTRSWTFGTTQTSSAQPTSAEWVAEAPSTCARTCRVLPLANFGTVTFTDAGATANQQAGTIGSFANDAITMTTRRGITRAQPSTLSATGDSFSDTWHHA